MIAVLPDASDTFVYSFWQIEYFQLAMLFLVLKQTVGVKEEKRVEKKYAIRK